MEVKMKEIMKTKTRRKEKGHVQIDENHRFTSDKNGYTLEKKVTTIDKNTKEEKTSWSVVGHYGQIYHLLKAMNNRGILDCRGMVTKINEHIKNFEQWMKDTQENVFITGKEKVVIKEKVVKETTKEYYETFPDDKRKKPKKIKTEYFDENGNKIREVYHNTKKAKEMGLDNA